VVCDIGLSSVKVRTLPTAAVTYQMNTVTLEKADHSKSKHGIDDLRVGYNFKGAPRRTRGSQLRESHEARRSSHERSQQAIARYFDPILTPF